MKKKHLFLGFFISLCFTQLSTAADLDKAKIETSIRQYLNLTSKQKIVVGDPKPSDFAGLQMISINIDGGEYPIYMAPDGVKYFWGQVFDSSKDMDKERASKISLTNVFALGSAQAPVTVVEFTDLQCPYCSKAHKSIKESLYKDFKPEQVRLVFKHFPLGMHDWAEKASIASECAGKQKKDAFWSMTDFYYEKQKDVTAKNIDEKTKEIIATLKLNSAQMTQCMADEKTKQKVNADKKEGSDVGVGGTPTFFVNGRMLRGTAYEDLKLLINEKLSGKK